MQDRRQKADLLLRPDATEYHRLKARGLLLAHDRAHPGVVRFGREDFPLSDI